MEKLGLTVYGIIVSRRNVQNRRDQKWWIAASFDRGYRIEIPISSTPADALAFDSLWDPRVGTARGQDAQHAVAIGGRQPCHTSEEYESGKERMMRLRSKFATALLMASTPVLLVGWPTCAHAASVAFSDLTIDNISISGNITLYNPSWNYTTSRSEVRAPNVSGATEVIDEQTSGGGYPDGNFRNTVASVFKPFEEGTSITSGTDQDFSNTTLFSHAVSGSTSGEHSARAKSLRRLNFLANGPTTIDVSLQYSLMHGVTSNEGTNFHYSAAAYSQIWIEIGQGVDLPTVEQKQVSSFIRWGTPTITPFETDILAASRQLSLGTGYIEIFGEVTTTARGTATTPSIPGQTQENTILPDPDSLPGSFQFSLDVGAGGLGTDFPIYIDPPVVEGFEYSVGPGDPNFASIVMPTGVDTTDGTFELWLPDNAGGFVLDSILTEGVEHFFPTGGVSLLQIRDIEPLLDPDDPNFDTAFPTGLTFVSSSSGTITMTPLSIPEPTALLLLGTGLAGFGFVRGRLSCSYR